MVVAARSDLSEQAAEVVKSIANLSMISGITEKSMGKASMADDSTGKSYLMSKTETEEKVLETKQRRKKSLREIQEEIRKLQQSFDEESRDGTSVQERDGTTSVHETEDNKAAAVTDEVCVIPPAEEDESLPSAASSMKDSVSVTIEDVDNEPTIEVKHLFSEGQLKQLVAVIDTALDKGTRKARKFAQEIIETSLSTVSSFAGYSTFGKSFADNDSAENVSADNDSTEKVSAENKEES